MNGPEDQEGAPEVYASATPFRPAEPDPLLQRAIPVAKELPGYGLRVVRDRAEAPVPTSAGDV